MVMPEWAVFVIRWGGLAAVLLLTLATIWRGEFAWWRSPPTRVRRAESPVVFWALAASLVVMSGALITAALGLHL